MTDKQIQQLVSQAIEEMKMQNVYEYTFCQENNRVSIHVSARQVSISVYTIKSPHILGIIEKEHAFIKYSRHREKPEEWIRPDLLKPYVNELIKWYKLTVSKAKAT